MQLTFAVAKVGGLWRARARKAFHAKSMRTNLKSERIGAQEGGYTPSCEICTHALIHVFLYNCFEPTVQN